MWAVVVLTVFALVFSSGCTGSPADIAEKFPAGQSDLQSAVWNLEYYMTEEGPVYVPEGVEVDLECINPGLIAGSAGCNGYSSPYFLDDGEISVENIFRTDMACIDRAGTEENYIMATEREYLERLANVSRAYILDGKLVFADSDYREMLVFTDSGTEPERLHPGRMAGVEDISGYTWELYPDPEKSAIRDLPSNVYVTLAFDEEGRFDGFSGFSDFSGTYTLEKGRFVIGMVMVNAMSSSMASGAPAVEEKFFEKFEQVKGAYVDGDKLFFLNENGVEVLSFEKFSPEGTEWTLSSYLDEDGSTARLYGGAAITLEFEGGQVSGNAGCNNYFGDYEADEKGSLAFGMIGITEMYCEGRMDTESRYISLLGDVASYSVNGETLTLYNGEGKRLLVFSRSAPFQPELPDVHLSTGQMILSVSEV